MQVFVFVVPYLSQVTFSNQIHSPCLDIVDSSIVLSHRPASLCSLVGPVQPYARVDFTHPARDYEFGYRT
jgi:hypothetical protein